MDEAKKIGRALLQKKFAGCINILPSMHSMYYWPPRSGVIEEADEVVVIAKSLQSKYTEVEKAVREFHSYDRPCVLSVPVKNMDKKYADWLKSEIE